MESGRRLSFLSQEELLVDQIEDCLSFYLGKAYQRVTQSAKQRLAPYGVTPVQYALLKVLWEQDQQSGAELGERLLLDSATMTGLLDRLEQAGLIERKAHATDRRVNRVALTARGRDLQAPLDREMDQMNEDFLGAFPAEERKLLRNLLIILAGWKQAPRTTTRTPGLREKPSSRRERHQSRERLDVLTEPCKARTSVMLFETKIALVIRDDLASWQKMNVAAFLASGIAASSPESIGDPYEDASGNGYLRLIGQPMLIYGADRVALSRVLERALARGVQPALYTEEMFSTTHDAANRDAVRSVEREHLNLVGLAIRAERKVVDKIVDKLKFHQ